MVIPFCKSSNIMCVFSTWLFLQKGSTTGPLLLQLQWKWNSKTAQQTCRRSHFQTCIHIATFSSFAGSWYHCKKNPHIRDSYCVLPTVCSVKNSIQCEINKKIYASCSYSMLFSSGWERNFENMTGFMPHSRGGKQKHVFFLPLPLALSILNFFVRK